MSCPPPRRFRKIENILWAKCAESDPPFLRDRKRRGKRAQGIRYERRVHEHFKSLYQERYISSPWLRFCADGDEPRWCQPDGLLFDIPAGRITIIEVKYQHTSDAWWQLRELYTPVIQEIFGVDWEYLTCEVVKWYDPATAFPERISMMKDIEDLRPGQFGVHIWKA